MSLIYYIGCELDNKTAFVQKESGFWSWRLATTRVYTEDVLHKLLGAWYSPLIPGAVIGRSSKELPIVSASILDKPEMYVYSLNTLDGVKKKALLPTIKHRIVHARKLTPEYFEPIPQGEYIAVAVDLVRDFIIFKRTSREYLATSFGNLLSWV